MSLRQRRFLYIIFITLFIVLVPAISFYAAGYEFNFKSGKVQRTGILVVKTEPKDALINLGEAKKYNWFYNFFYKNAELRTPQKMRNILPGKYKLTLSKDGYSEYSRDIEIKPGQSVVLDNIVLFKNSIPERLLETGIINSSFSPDENNLALLASKELVVVKNNFSHFDRISLASRQNLKTDLFWAPSSKKILLNNPNYSIINTESGEVELNLQSYFSGKIQSAQWDNFSDDTIYVKSNNLIYRFAIAQQKSELVFERRVSGDFIIKDNFIYFIASRSGESVLFGYNLDNDKLAHDIILPTTSTWRFLDSQENIIYLYDVRHETAYLIDPNSFMPIRDSLSNVRELKIIDNNKIVYWNDFEIWHYDISNQNKNLITRISDKIDKVWWYVNSNYVLYSTADGIKTIELENGNYAQLVDILQFENISNPALSHDNRFICFASNGWLYKLEIR